jgi:hypothetical protein
LLFNTGNRSDSTALVIEQRMLEEMLGQPLTAASCTAPVCPDAQATTWNLGSAAMPRTMVGSPVAVVNHSPAIDFSAAQVPGYHLSYVDPEDPYGATYDVRWAVVTYVNGSVITGKRFLISSRQVGGAGYFLPMTLDSTVAK